MGSIFDSPDVKLPPVAPIPIPETDDKFDALKRRRKRKGRAETVLTGALEPLDIGKRTLLG